MTGVIVYITNTQNRRGGSKTVPQKRLSATAPASAVARERRHNYTRPVSRNPRATSTPRSTSMPLNVVFEVPGRTGGREHGGRRGLPGGDELARASRQGVHPPSVQSTKRHTANENLLLSMDVAHHVVTGVAYPEFRYLAIGYAL